MPELRSVDGGTPQPKRDKLCSLGMHLIVWENAQLRVIINLTAAYLSLFIVSFTRQFKTQHQLTFRIISYFLDTQSIHTNACKTW
jgi:hypothetical protein